MRDPGALYSARTSLRLHYPLVPRELTSRFELERSAHGEVLVSEKLVGVEQLPGADLLAHFEAGDERMLLLFLARHLQRFGVRRFLRQRVGMARPAGIG